MAFALSKELTEHQAVAVSLSPGWIRSEAMLEHFGVTDLLQREQRAHALARDEVVIGEEHGDRVAHSPIVRDSTPEEERAAAVARAEGGVTTLRALCERASTRNVLDVRLLTGSMVTAAIAAALAVSARASTPALHVTPSSVHRGGTVTFTGAGCRRGETVFLISRLFPGHAFGGEGAITTIARYRGHFTRSFRVRRTTRRGRYVITARCGGGNLGVAAHLRVS